MKSGAEIPSLEERRRQAAEWVVEHDAGELSLRRLAEFEAWKSSHQGNDREFSRLTALWSDLDDVIGKKDRPSQPIVRPPASRSWLPASLAASLILLTTLLAVSIVPRNDTVELVSNYGSQHHVLSDGSTITLNASSQATVVYAKSERKVELKSGEALFNVTHDPDRPFIVKAGPANVKVLGTVFAIELLYGQVSVAVLEGKVRIDSASHREYAHHYATPGEHVHMNPLGEVRVQQFDDTAHIVAWTEGRLIFKGDPLSQALERVNRHTERPIALGAPDLADSPVYGSFNASDTKGIVSALSASLGLTLVELPDGSFVLEHAAM